MPPAPYFEQYLSRRLRPPALGSWAQKPDRAQNTTDGFTAVLSERQIHAMQAGYYGLITHLDHQLGRLIRELRDEGVLNDTVLLFTSDHGEMLGDHYMLRKSQPYEGSCHVPLLLWDPGGHLGLPKGARCSALAELRDVMPTLLEAAGLPIPDSVDGKPLLGAARTGSEVRQSLHGEHTAQCGAPHSAHYMLEGPYKYIWYSHTGCEQLFDLARDPRELQDLACDPAHQQALARLRGLLARQLAGREEGYSDGTRLIVGRPPVTVLRHPLCKTEDALC